MLWWRRLIDSLRDVAIDFCQFPCLVYRLVVFSPWSYTRTSIYGQHWDFFSWARWGDDWDKAFTPPQIKPPRSGALSLRKWTGLDTHVPLLYETHSRSLHSKGEGLSPPAPCPLLLLPEPPPPPHKTRQSLRRPDGNGLVWLIIKLPVNVGRWGYK